MTISANLVKELRDKTGAGMMDCKAALTEVKGDIEAAIDWLRKKGLSKAAKKAGRIAAEGLIGINVSGKSGSVVEVNSETDFVARNEQFQEMVTNIAALAGKAGGDVAKLLAMTYPGKKITVEDQVKELIATIGENMSLRRTATLQVPEGVVGSLRAQPGGPRPRQDRRARGAGNLRQERRRARRSRPPARHACRRHQSRRPRSRRRAGRDAGAREGDPRRQEQGQAPAGHREDRRQRLSRATARTTVCWSRSTSTILKSVTQALKDAEGKVGGPIKLTGFVRFALGEGIEKKEDDFAAEVAAAVGASN